MATKRRSHKRAKARESAIAGGRAIIGKLLPAGPLCLDRDLDAAFAGYRSDGGRWHALEAVSRIAAKRMAESSRPSADFDGIEPTTMIPVPWWAVHALMIAWCSFRRPIDESGRPLDAESSPSLGEAFEVEAPRRGAPSGLAKADREMADRMLALMVAERLGKDPSKAKVEAEIVEVAALNGMSKSKVWAAWSKYGPDAERRLAIFSSSPK